MTIGELTQELDTLAAQVRTVTASVDAQIADVQARLKALQMQREVLLEPYVHTRDTLQAALRVRVLEEGVTRVQGETFTCSRTERVQWDDEGLQAFAQEQPSVMQWRQVVPSTTWRWR